MDGKKNPNDSHNYHDENHDEIEFFQGNSNRTYMLITWPEILYSTYRDSDIFHTSFMNFISFYLPKRWKPLNLFNLKPLYKSVSFNV